ncbi:phospholipid-transporting ATPase ABCA3-like [Babylonia areolata]|uniref:phospholipid-transporting ATPase ABCA3-like n=1 Tax=Babylonia areolata TaxID=304850 RepID=UPI003FD27B1F
MAFLRQLTLLLWKNMLLQRRKVAVSIFEILLPVAFATVIVCIRILTKPEKIAEPTIYNATSPNGYNIRHFFSSVTEIGFTPDTPLARHLADNVLDDLIRFLSPLLPFFNHSLPRPARVYPIGQYANQTFGVRGFQTQGELEDYYKAFPRHVAMGLVFRDLGQASALPPTLSYFLRPPTARTQRWRTGATFPFFQTRVPRESSQPDYTMSGVMMMQRFVTQTLVREWTGGVTNSSQTFDLALRRMPYPPYVKDRMVTVLQTQLPLFLILSFILSVIQNTKNIVYEKERKLKESMKLMGLIPAAHWASWFLTCFLYLAVAMAIYAILFGVNIVQESGPVLAFSDPSLFYVFLLCYALAIITFCFMVSVFVQKANIGAAVGGIIFFATYLPNFFLSSRYETMTSGQKLAACLLFNQAMAFGANVIGLFEGTGEGSRWSNVYKRASVDDNFSLLDAMLMLLLDSFLHLLITWYLDNVRPGDFGVPKPLYFCFTKSYWCGTSSKGPGKVYSSGNREGDRYFEQEPSGLLAGIRVCNLTKTFGKKKVAVNKLSLNMYEGQITVLLGHNGAGKTTTMSMLTGFIPPTSGTAYINDKDIRTDMDSVRQSLGLCPQHNILFGSLTVEEHLVFFAKLKGCVGSEVRGEVDRMVKEVGLEHKRKAAARTLSGGQKRKLSVAIALIAGSKIIVLDEPTSGMDPAARRETWDVLQRARAGRTLLLSTHFMDEADLLGDRIAIMAEGVVQCCGTSMFLKKLYGAGYHLVLVKGPDCKVPAVTKVIQDTIPSALLETHINAEVTYLLPDNQSALFPELFDKLDDLKEKLGILHFGATATTMEEVFLRVGENASSEEGEEEGEGGGGGVQGVVNQAYEADKDKASLNGQHSAAQDCRLQTMTIATDTPATDVLAFSRGYTKATGLPLQWSRLRGLVVKKALHFWRNRVITLVQLLLPVIFTIIALAVDKARPQTLTEPPLDFNLSPFGATTIPYSNGSRPDTESNAAAEVYSRQFGNDQTTVKVDLNQRSVLNFLLDKATEIGTSTYNKRVIVGAEFEPSRARGLRVTAWYNGQPFHAEPISLAYALNGLARHYVNSSVTIRSGVHPLPKDEDADAQANLFLALSTGFTVGFCISIGMAFLTTSFIFFIVKERVTGAKHVQVVSGVGPVVFWVSNLLWDYVNYLLPSLLLLLVFLAYGTEAYVEGGRLGLVALVLAMYGLAILPFVYLAHFLFSTPPTAMAVGIVFSIFSGLVTMTTVFVMALIPDVQALGRTLNWVFMALFPNHCMSRAFMDIYTNYLNNDFCTNTLNYTVTCYTRSSPCCRGIGLGCSNESDTCLWFSQDYVSWEEPGIGRYLLFLGLQALVFFGATLLVENGFFRRLAACLVCCTRRARPASQPLFINGSSVSQEDDDVAAERRRVNATPASVLAQRDSLLLVNLYKQYGPLVAVDHTCVGVPEQECFGLLGQNGAGKTTTFKMLTGDMPVTGGNAYLKGFDVKRSLKQVQANMGYCPQFDALIEQMTGRETLTMYGRLRGVPEKHLKACVNDLLDVLLLRPHADKLTSDYSGGNKRKLSTAMALMGDPPFLLLDEPSTGMDPAARRQLWNVLSSVRASGRTLVLTSHSMEECEALCTRMAIMVNGRFVCLGSTQHLKSKFGQGYTLVAKMAPLPDGQPAPIQPFTDHILALFPSARLFDSHQGYAHMQLPDPEVRLAQVFSAMEKAKQELQVQDYNVHQTTLEQVFLAFTRGQVAPKESSKKSCLKRFCCCCC